MTTSMQRLQHGAGNLATVLVAVGVGTALFVAIMMPFVFPVAVLAVGCALARVGRRAPPASRPQAPSHSAKIALAS